jgi:4-hydroxybenzoate polyprenyltransferase
VRRGEGQLLAINLSLIVAAGSGLASGFLQGVFSALLLVTLYFVNDVLDAPGDVHDPGKNQAFVGMLLRHRPWFITLLAVEHLLFPILAWSLFGWRSGLSVAGVLAVNIAYSSYLKGIAFVDAPAVGIWGLLYASVVGAELPFRLFASVGCMTMVAHVFQIMRDRHVDALTSVRTSAVAYGWLPTLHMAGACAGLAACIATDLGPWAGISAGIPLLLHKTLRSNQAAWLAAKAYFGVVWIMLLCAVQIG